MISIISIKIYFLNQFLNYYNDSKYFFYVQEIIYTLSKLTIICTPYIKLIELYNMVNFFIFLNILFFEPLLGNYSIIYRFY